MSVPNNLARVIELERADAAKLALQEAANDLEALKGNEVYERAYRKAADFIRLKIFKKHSTT